MRTLSIFGFRLCRGLPVRRPGRIRAAPTPLELALDQVHAWLESPSLVMLAESSGYQVRLRPLLTAGRVTGPQATDARVAALCLHHGIEELWSADRDFSRFPELKVRNPLAGD